MTALTQPAPRRLRREIHARVRRGTGEATPDTVPDALKFAERYTTSRKFNAILFWHAATIATVWLVPVIIRASLSVTITVGALWTAGEILKVEREFRWRKGAFAAEAKNRALLKDQPVESSDANLPA